MALPCTRAQRSIYEIWAILLEDETLALLLFSLSQAPMLSTLHLSPHLDSQRDTPSQSKKIPLLHDVQWFNLLGGL